MRALRTVWRAAVAAAFLAGPAAAQDGKAYGGLRVVEVPMPSASADVLGRPLAYPPGTPEVRAFRITIPPGTPTALHAHEVPLFAYVISGAVEVDYGDGGKHLFKAGDAFVEAVNRCHAGRSVGDVPAELLAVFLGGGGLKNTVDCPR